MTNDSIPEVEHLPRAEMTDKTTNYPLEANLERLQAQMQNMEEETRFGFLEHFLKGSAWRGNADYAAPPTNPRGKMKRKSSGAIA